MRLKPKEKAKIKKRRKLWATMGFHWPYKRAAGGRYKTEYTDDPEDGKGMGFFRKNHTLCGCRICQLQKEEKRHKNKVARKRSKEEILQELKSL